VTQVLPGTPADEAGIRPGAEILEWDGKPVSDALDSVEPDFGPYSTYQHKRLEQLVFLTRVPEDTRVEIVYRNPYSSDSEQVRLTAVIDYDSLFAALPAFQRDEIALPVEGEVLNGSGLGYIRINTFSDDYNLTAQIWDHYIQGMLDNEVPGLIIDVRTNSGGSGSLSLDFAGYFFEEEITLFDRLYYSERTGRFEPNGDPSKVIPGPTFYPGEVAVLVSPYCVSACEGFSYALTQDERATIVGHYPTAGAFGEVGRGQYELPEDISLQFPTGRPEDPNGDLVIEGVGVEPDILVPVTEASAMGEADAVLDAAVDALLDRLDD
jgi:C-terminal processing protease CtpA/Prc